MTNWIKDDFIITEEGLMGFSESGKNKIKNTDTLVIPEGVQEIVCEPFKDIPIKKLVLPSTLKFIGCSSFKRSGIEEIIGGENVEEIGAYAFYENNLSSVMNFKSLKIIGGYAFSNNKIQKFCFYNKLQFVGVNAFEENRLKEVDLSDRWKAEIGNYAFSRNMIEKIRIVKNSNISKTAFRYNKFKSNLFVDTDTTKSISYNEEVEPDSTWKKHHFIIYEEAFKDLSKEGLKKIRMSKNITFPKIEGVTKIDFNLGSITLFTDITRYEVYISEGIEEIGKNTFSSEKISAVHLPDSLKSIDYSAFSQTSIKNIKFSKNLEELSDEVLFHSKIESVDLSETKIKKIPIACFSYCYNLKEIKLPKSLEEIDISAFQMNYSLREITVPENTTCIKKFAFYKSGLEKINFTNPKVFHKIGCSAFKHARLKHFPFEEIQYLEMIGERAFERSDLEEVMINKGSEVQERAFKSNNIKEVQIEEVEKLSKTAFEGNNVIKFNVSDSTNIVDDDVFKDEKI